MDRYKQMIYLESAFGETRKDIPKEHERMLCGYSLRICDEKVNKDYDKDYMQSLLPLVVHFTTTRNYLESCPR